MATDPRIDSRTGEALGWGWLNSTTVSPLPIHGMRDPHNHTEEPTDEWEWLAHAATDPQPSGANNTEPRRGMPMPPVAVWLTIAFGIAATIAVVAVLAPTSPQQDREAAAEPTVALASTSTVQPSSPPATPSSPACTGLAGSLVTATTASSGSSVMQAISGFEHAYYVARDVEAALRWLAPGAGIAPEPLAAGIASIPFGTEHCVAITAIAETAATVHLVEVRPDGQRIDYLQVINVRPTGDGSAVITNIQRQGS
ncbi:hypothetical protein [Nocardia sp. XZ_19_385]|uniref:hypothetical protein n=1 Tax=Nocardia sp. XZ_19_385 TaxID=2769488 RepID=UPI00188DE833|nr:hypothetical protein [Nocardia sp. XZ_19_385]